MYRSSGGKRQVKFCNCLCDRFSLVVFSVIVYFGGFSFF